MRTCRDLKGAIVGWVRLLGGSVTMSKGGFVRVSVKDRVLRPKRATSSQDRASWAWRTMGQRRSHTGQRQPFLKGLTHRCSSVSRCLNEKAVIFRSFRRKIFASNVRRLWVSSLCRLLVNN